MAFFSSSFFSFLFPVEVKAKCVCACVCVCVRVLLAGISGDETSDKRLVVCVLQSVALERNS